MKRIGIILIIGVFLSACEKENEDDKLDFAFPAAMTDTISIGDTLEYMFYITPKFAKIKMYLEGPIDNLAKKPGHVFAEYLLDSLVPRSDLTLIYEVTCTEGEDCDPSYWEPFSWIPSDEIEENKMYCFSVEINWLNQDVPFWHWGKFIYMKSKE